MRFIIGNKIYNLGFLVGSADEEWRLRFTEGEGLVLTTPDEIDVLNSHGDPTGEKTIVWIDALTVATGEDAAKLWEVVKRVLVSEKLAMDVDSFLTYMGEHDAAVAAGLRLAREKQRIQAEAAMEEVRTTEGLTLPQIVAAQSGFSGGPPPRVGRSTQIVPPYGGTEN